MKNKEACQHITHPSNACPNRPARFATISLSRPDAEALLTLLGSTVTFPDVVEALREALDRCVACESPLLNGECTSPYCANNPDAKSEGIA